VSDMWDNSDVQGREGKVLSGVWRGDHLGSWEGHASSTGADHEVTDATKAERDELNRLIHSERWGRLKPDEWARFKELREKVYKKTAAVGASR